MDLRQREEVIEYARKVVIQTGIKSLRMDDVAQATRISKRTLYETFGDKEELLFQAVKTHFDIFEHSNFSAAKNADNILIAILIIMEEIRKNADTNWQIRSSLKRFYPNISDRLQNDKADEKRKFVTSSLQMGVDQGLIDQRINIPLTIKMFNYIAIGVSQNNEMIDIPADVNIEDAFMEVVINFIRGISTIKGVKLIDEYLADTKKNKE